MPRLPFCKNERSIRTRIETSYLNPYPSIYLPGKNERSIRTRIETDKVTTSSVSLQLVRTKDP